MWELYKGKGRKKDRPVRFRVHSTRVTFEGLRLRLESSKPRVRVHSVSSADKLVFVFGDGEVFSEGLRAFPTESSISIYSRNLLRWIDSVCLEKANSDRVKVLQNTPETVVVEVLTPVAVDSEYGVGGKYVREVGLSERYLTLPGDLAKDASFVQMFVDRSSGKIAFKLLRNREPGAIKLQTISKLTKRAYLRPFWNHYRGYVDIPEGVCRYSVDELHYDDSLGLWVIP